MFASRIQHLGGKVSDSELNSIDLNREPTSQDGSAIGYTYIKCIHIEIYIYICVHLVGGGNDVC